jgi:tetratricopeptide (TPR) repeat protein
MTPQLHAAVQAAAQRLDAGRPDEARALLEPVVRSAPRFADAQHLYGVALLKLGEAAGAAAALGQAISVDGRKAPFHVALGDARLALGDAAGAEAAYRAALALDPRNAPAVRQLASLLTDLGRAEEALALLSPLITPQTVNFGLLNAQGAALKALGRLEEAAEAYRRAAEAAPTSGVAEHNLAAVLGDLARHREADVAARRAYAKGLAAPETRLVHARTLLALGELDAAEAMFQDAIRRRPLYVEAHRDLAQLIWMRTEDKARATAALDAALGLEPAAVALRQVKARVLIFAGDAEGADAELQAAVARSPNDAALHLSAAQAAIGAGDALRGLEHAERARALIGADDPQAVLFLCEALLAVGRADQAAALAEPLLDRLPDGQQAIACLATAWRILGDPRAAALYDYDAFVRAYTIDTPKGWPSLAAYLADVAEALNARHRLKTHPLDQSLRQGSQISDVFALDDPALKAFPEALDGPIRAHIAALGEGDDPLRRRNTGGYRFKGAWSVKLRPGGGRHVDHIHPEGWLSSACYIDLPGAVAGEGRQGWIKFGEPGLTTMPALPPEHFVKPEPGRLVLFPSYMWHGTVPFEGPDSRLTIAFDLLPG